MRKYLVEYVVEQYNDKGICYSESHGSEIVEAADSLEAMRIYAEKYPGRTIKRVRSAQ